ncbi:MAG: DUF3892 domain-containing protein [Phycisphaerae bacterium]
MAVRIRFVVKTDSTEPNERIKDVGGINNNGTLWRFSQKAIIEDIEADQYQYYVSIDNRTVPVIVAQSHSGKKYLKTELDGEQPDSILNLPSFP